jgi:AcrR family transcriptional regulator
MNHRSPSERPLHKLPKRPKLKDRLREQTEAAILAAAEQVFAAEGVHDASMGQIARAAGVAVGTLYNHFVDRDALLRSLMDLRRGELLARLDRSLAELQRAPFRARLEGLLRAMASHVDEHRPFLRILLDGDHRPPPERREAGREIRARIDKLLAAGRRERALKADPNDLQSALLLGGLKALMLRDEVRIEPLVPALIAQFLEGAA